MWTDYHNFHKESLKMCVEIFDKKKAEQMEKELPNCDILRFSDGYWYKFTRKGVTKENAITQVCSACDLSYKDIIAFGDDYVDIRMLKLSGIGVAMGNAIDQVKEAADIVIGSNDEEGIAAFIENISDNYFMWYNVFDNKMTNQNL